MAFLYRTGNNLVQYSIGPLVRNLKSDKGSANIIILAKREGGTVDFVQILTDCQRLGDMLYIYLILG